MQIVRIGDDDLETTVDAESEFALRSREAMLTGNPIYWGDYVVYVQAIELIDAGTLQARITATRAATAYG